MEQRDALAMPNGAAASPSADRLVVLSHFREGHRGDYADFVAGLFDVEVRSSGWPVADRRPVLFLMIEEAFLKYVVLSLGRAALGRLTVGLLFRGGEAARARTMRLRLKKAALGLLKRIGAVRTLSIVPFPLDPEIAQVADDWIYDFQLWDRPSLAVDDVERGKAATGSYAAELRNAPAGRRLAVSLGRQNAGKGLELIARHAPAFAASGWTPVIAGPLAGDAEDAAAAIATAGGIVIRRFLTEQELLDAYRTADLVWCVYHPAYDQASGILGRAIQAGVPVAVRESSVSHRLCESEGLAHVPVPWLTGDADIGAALAEAVRLRRSDSGPMIARFREHSLAKLRTALWPTAACPAAAR